MTEPTDDLHREFDTAVRGAYRAVLPGDDEARARVRAELRVRAESARAWTGSRLFSPTAAFAALAACIVLGTFIGLRLQAPGVEHSAQVAATQESVTFALRAPGATSVALVGDFNGWDPATTPLRREATSDVWTTSLPLGAGLYTYAYLVDGREWRADPAAPLAPASAYGGSSSLLVVREEDAL